MKIYYVEGTVWAYAAAENEKDAARIAEDNKQDICAYPNIDWTTHEIKDARLLSKEDLDSLPFEALRKVGPDITIREYLAQSTQ